MDTTVIQSSSNRASAAGTAFDQLAADYDQRFTDSIIGRAQRDAVWKILTNTFKANDNILELNCGTGEDAIFLAGRGISVFACDASQQMIARAEQRLSRESPLLPVVFCHLPTELSDLVNQGDRLLLCFSTRFCLIEVLHYLIRGQCQKAFRRCKGHTVATLANLQLPVYYPTLREICSYFAPHFKLRSYTGIGVAVPPSYCESWARRHRSAFRLLCRLEEILAAVPILRVTGDHVLICFEKVSK